MTTTEYQALVIGQLNKVFEHPVLVGMLTIDQKRLIRSQLEFWHNADVATLQLGLNCLNAEPA